MFLYPEFCDVEPGPLTNEHRANGVNNMTKSNSYLMDLGGVSYNELFGDLFTLLTSAYLFLFWELPTIIRKSLKGAQAEAAISQIKSSINISEKNELLMSKFKPLFEKIESSLTILHKANIVHNDLHSGNILLEWEKDDAMDGWISHMKEFIQSIRNSNNFKSHGTTLKYYTMTLEVAIGVFTLIEKMKDVDFSKIVPKIIDWDSAKLIETEDDSETAENEFVELLSHLLPGGELNARLTDLYFK